LLLEYEEKDYEKEYLLTNTLVQQWGETLVKTAGLRKRNPKDVRSRIKKLCRHELRFLVRRTFVCFVSTFGDGGIYICPCLPV